MSTPPHTAPFRATDPSGRSDPMAPAVARVLRRRSETPDTFTLDLEVELGPSFRFAPGQFNMLYVFGTGEAPLSISGDPANPAVLVHTTRAVGVVTRALQRLRPGDALGVRGPFGRGWPLDEAEGRDVVVLAGGIGLAPLRPVLYHLFAHRARYGRVLVLYGARTPADLLYGRELSAWREQPHTGIRVTVDRATGAWRGHVGVLTTLLPRALPDPARTVALLCGPEIMMHVAVQELRRRGVEPQRIYVSMERNMQCGIGLCGHCQYGPFFVCKDGPVFRFDRVEDYFSIRAY